MAQPPTDQCIVLPFRGDHRQPFNGTGLALHFLVGNVLALHTGLKEMWFGWRVKTIFPEKARFQRYCRDAASKLDLVQISQSQRVRLWLYGNFSDQTVNLNFFDGQAPNARHAPVDLPISIDDGLIEFRTQLIQMAGIRGPAHARRAGSGSAVVRNDQPRRPGCRGPGTGRVLYLFGLWGDDGPLDVSPFKKAVTVAPESFMAQDLYGWALYRNQDYAAAGVAFLTP
jgi:hypothetical protein